MPLAEGVLDAQNGPRREAPCLAVASHHFQLPFKEEENLASRGRMPVAIPADRSFEEGVLFSWDERREMNRRRRRRELDCVEVDVDLLPVRDAIQIGVEICVLHG